MNDYILTTENICKKYGNFTALNGVSVRIKKGEIYGIIGKNGSGKTTFFRVLTGLIQKYSGTVHVNDTNNRKSVISAVINSPSLFLNLSGFENMKVQSFLLGIEDKTKISQVLKTVGLSDASNKTVKNFSLGMTQRLKLGMALLENPDILILDEPANGLDPDGIVELRELLLDLNKSGITILVSSHILGELGKIVTRLGIMQNGKIIKELSDQETLQDVSSLEKIYMAYAKGRGDYDI